MADAHCSEVQELIPELAAGVASGEVRARALSHIIGCVSCRRELEEVSATVDELLLLAPEREPAPGFDLRVLSSLGESLPKRRPLRTSLTLVAASAVVAAAAAAGITWSRGADDRNLADEYRDALVTAHGSSLRAANITWDGTTYGHLFAYQGDPSWLFMTIKAPGSGSYPVRLVTTDGQSMDIGVCTLRNGTGSWGTTLDLPIRSIDRVELVRAGSPTMVANLQS